MSAWLLFANNANCGVYQRTKDGRTFVLNNFPRRGDSAIWSGARDADGYATGYGTLTWYKSDRTIVTGSNIPAPTKGNVARGRYSGKMVKGKFQGMVVNIDANGQTFHGTFVNGAKTSDWIAGPPPSSKQESGPSVSKSAANKEPAPPAAGPSHVAVTTLAQPRPTSTRSMLQSNPGEIEPAVKNRMISDFKEQTQSVFSRVSDATGNFQDVDRLNSVQRLPSPVSEDVASLVDRARDFRVRLGYETALSECRAETETVDALSTLEQSTRNIADNNAAAANSGLNDFLKSNPEPPQDSEKSLWRYLTSVRSLCSRLEKEAEVRSQRAQAFASAGKTGQAIREYQEAYRIFPNPATAEKIRQLQSNSLGL
ncbi:MAG TPA: hypothetical protein VG103_07150 [Chthoniobacterales bacterium]|nr:hypothetical protein [Chthoniobacterales bacterium]